jgi:hypothetical protein
MTLSRRLIVFLAIPLFALAMIAAVPSFSAAQSPFDDICATVPEGKPKPSTCADNEADAGKDRSETNPLTGKDGIILRAARLVSFITGVASVVIIIIGGIKYATSNGDSNSVNSAKNTILYAAVGLVISIAAQSIILFVIAQL